MYAQLHSLIWEVQCFHLLLSLIKSDYRFELNVAPYFVQQKASGGSWKGKPCMSNEINVFMIIILISLVCHCLTGVVCTLK